MWESEKLEKQVFYMENHPKTVACFTGVQCIDDEGKYVDSELFIMEN